MSARVLAEAAKVATQRANGVGANVVTTRQVKPMRATTTLNPKLSPTVSGTVDKQVEPTLNSKLPSTMGW